MVPVPFKPTFFSARALSPYQTQKYVAWKLCARRIAVPGLKKRRAVPGLAADRRLNEGTSKETKELVYSPPHFYKKGGCLSFYVCVLLTGFVLTL